MLRLLFIVLIANLHACVFQPGSEDRDFKIANTNLQLGMGYLQQGKIEYALEKLEKALVAKPDYAEVHTALAFVYQRLREDESAKMHYLEAIDLKPKDGGVHNNYGVFLCQNGFLKEADEQFAIAVNSPRYQTPEIVYENAGACAYQGTHIQRAEDYMRKALSINPKLPNALYVMAEVMFSRDRYLLSRAYLQRFEAVSKHTAESLWLGIKAERRLGAKDVETKYAKLLQRDFPDSMEFKELLNTSQKEYKE